MLRPITSTALVAALALSLGACGSSPKKPGTELAMTDAALQSAEVAGAREYAPIELRTAREKKEMADRKMDQEEYGDARRLTDQATADAELAKAKAEAEKSRLALREVQDGIQMMRQEIVRANAR